jgi:cell division protein FtsL
MLTQLSLEIFSKQKTNNQWKQLQMNKEQPNKKTQVKAL